MTNNLPEETNPHVFVLPEISSLSAGDGFILTYHGDKSGVIMTNPTDTFAMPEPESAKYQIVQSLDGIDPDHIILKNAGNFSFNFLGISLQPNEALICDDLPTVKKLHKMLDDTIEGKEPWDGYIAISANGFEYIVGDEGR
jgi:hypothetical protein